MSTRIKSAAVALVIAIVLLILHDTFVFNIALGFITAMAIWEIFRATKFDKHFKVCDRDIPSPQGEAFCRCHIQRLLRLFPRG